MGPAGRRRRTVTTSRTALMAHERQGGHAAARYAALARSAIALYSPRIADRPRLKFLSRIPTKVMTIVATVERRSVMPCVSRPRVSNDSWCMSARDGQIPDGGAARHAIGRR